MMLVKIKMNLMEIGLLFIFFELLTKTTKGLNRLEAKLNIQINEQILVTVSAKYCFFSGN